MLARILFPSLLFSLLFCAALTGCVQNKAYQVSNVGQSVSITEPIVCADTENGKPMDRIAAVEFDEFGSPFNRKQLDRAVTRADEVIADKGTVLLYIHGWHHNAGSCDDNLVQFHRLVEEIQKEEDFRRGKESPDERPAGQVLGIYVGWRGQQAPGWPELLNNATTFWARKSVAHEIGTNGGVYELLYRLGKLHGHQTQSRLILVGHSFGGALLYTSLSHQIVSEILEDPQPGQAAPDKAADRPSWNLALIVNPAFEAIRLRPQWDLARSRSYTAAQLPHIIIVTTTADGATGSLFPIGRRLDSVFKSYPDGDDYARAMNIDAVGHYIPYVTHQLLPTKACEKGSVIALTSNIKAVASEGKLCFTDVPDHDKPSEPAKLLLQRCDAAGVCDETAKDHHLLRCDPPNSDSCKNKAAKETVKPDYILPARFPIMNVRTSGAVMKNHVDIWNPTMREFVKQLLIVTVKSPEDVPVIEMK